MFQKVGIADISRAEGEITHSGQNTVGTETITPMKVHTLSQNNIVSRGLTTPIPHGYGDAKVKGDAKVILGIIIIAAAQQTNRMCVTLSLIHI